MRTREDLLTALDEIDLMHQQSDQRAIERYRWHVSELKHTIQQTGMLVRTVIPNDQSRVTIFAGFQDGLLQNVIADSSGQMDTYYRISRHGVDIAREGQWVPVQDPEMLGHLKTFYHQTIINLGNNNAAIGMLKPVLPGLDPNQLTHMIPAVPPQPPIGRTRGKR